MRFTGKQFRVKLTFDEYQKFRKELMLGPSEGGNDLTKEADVSSVQDILKQFRQSDTQMFTGWKNYHCCFDVEIYSMMVKNE